ncbi:DEAD/DEAH box helicase [Bartonella bovis]|uniref:DEAD/DEAH box helicase n=1 Tax=Bartonella bovis TaxID=155194 RepID=UPI000C9A81C1|nr:DEAD/DEAH box helicase [Bartonella bovis]
MVFELKRDFIVNIKEDTFVKLGIPAFLTQNLSVAGINKPKPIQKQAIPIMLKKRDILGIAQTGSGKTLAFGLPVLSQVLALGDKRYPKTARALILVPTRELAVQVEESICMIAKGSHLSTCLILGGMSRFAQIKRMKTGVDILIATPGRLMDLVCEKCIDLSQTCFFVLDEADRMLDMGFIHDVRRIAKLLHEKRQTALFSATMPKEIVTLAKSLLNEPIKIEVVPQGTVATEITQKLYCVPTNEKKSVLNKLLTNPALALVIVFTRTKHGADAVARNLTKTGYSVATIHGNKSHAARQRALKAFREGSVRILVATDIAARGIDVPGVSHVINYDLPDEADNYVHRIGRTGRNGTSGNAVILFDEKVERARLRAVERVIRMKLTHEDIPPQFAAFPEISFIPENGKKHCLKKTQYQKKNFDHIDKIKQSHNMNSSSKSKRYKKANTTAKRAKSFRFRKSIKQVA